MKEEKQLIKNEVNIKKEEMEMKQSKEDLIVAWVHIFHEEGINMTGKEVELFLNILEQSIVINNTKEKEDIVEGLVSENNNFVLSNQEDLFSDYAVCGSLKVNYEVDLYEFKKAIMNLITLDESTEPLKVILKYSFLVENKEFKGQLESELTQHSLMCYVLYEYIQLALAGNEEVLESKYGNRYSYSFLYALLFTVKNELMRNGNDNFCDKLVNIDIFQNKEMKNEIDKHVSKK